MLTENAKRQPSIWGTFKSAFKSWLCVTLDKVLILSEPQFACLSKVGGRGDDNVGVLRVKGANVFERQGKG